ncbi:MAG: patatin-like phospholipase family protein [Dehalococcoidales bacterium]
MKKKKVGIALGGGAARGMAHIGVLERLEKENIPIDIIAGTSAGAIVGALFAKGMSAAEIKREVLDIDLLKRWKLIDVGLPKTGFIGGKKLMAMLQSYIGDIDFSELKMPFTCTATDILSGEEVVIDKGPVIEGVRASIAVPIVFAACERNGRFLVDGGLVDQVPVDLVRDMGADIVIAVSVSPRMPNVNKRVTIDEAPSDNKGKTKKPNMYTIMMNHMGIINSQTTTASLERADIVIEPRLTGISFTDFKKAEQCITEGDFAAIDAMLEIKRLLAQ